MVSEFQRRADQVRRGGRAALRKGKTMASSGGQPQQAGRRLRAKADQLVRRGEALGRKVPPKVAQWRELGPEATAADVKRQMERAAAGVRERATNSSVGERVQLAAAARSTPAPGDGAAQVPLSVVVIVYDMSAQARRTLYTLSTAYQRDVSVDDYEVIVVENASDDQLTRRQVERMGPNFRYLRRDEPGVSPAPAINAGLALARGEFIGLMIDGARMLTPGVIRNALDGFKVNPNAVVAAPGYHIGLTDQQHSSHSSWWSVRKERALMRTIPWRTDGYRLFDISVLSGANPFGYLHPLMESNCMFASRANFDAIGGADERFDLPGGGVLNLHMYRELLEPEHAQLILMPGEGSFHQFHGGVTTRRDSERADLMAQFNSQYQEIKGSGYFAPRREPFLIGTIPNRALPVMAYSAVEGRTHYETWTLREPAQVPYVDDATIPAPDILKHPPSYGPYGSTNGELDVSIYLPPSIRRFEPKHIVFSTWMDHIQFGYDLVAAVRPEILVELGTQGGVSYFAFCQSMKENDVEGLAYAVDTWEGEEHTGAYDESVWESVSWHNRQNYSAFSYLLRMYFAEAVNNFADESIDLLHIDGLHTYDAVNEDFETWYPKVAPGGIILFHDIKARIKDFGVWRWWDEVSPQYPSFSFNHGFGLGVIQKPGGKPNESELLQLMFDGSPADQAQLRRFYEHAAYFHHVKRQAEAAR